MESRKIIYQMLQNSFLDIRASADDRERVFFMADMFHNLPTYLERWAEDPLGFDKALRDFREWAETRGPDYVRWLDETIQNTKQNINELR